MEKFKNDLVKCQKCQKESLVTVKDFQKGSFICQHKGCGHANQLFQTYYDDKLLIGLPHAGQLVAIGNPTEVYLLKLGENIIGVGDQATIKLNKKLHNGKCYVSRQHCTITVVFDKWHGVLRYLLEDGVIDLHTRERKYSLNNTLLKGKKVEKQEIIDIATGESINLGGEDAYCLKHHLFSDELRNSYKVMQRLNENDTFDLTQ
jgi:FHA domain